MYIRKIIFALGVFFINEFNEGAKPNENLYRALGKVSVHAENQSPNSLAESSFCKKHLWEFAIYIFTYSQISIIYGTFSILLIYAFNNFILHSYSQR